MKSKNEGCIVEHNKSLFSEIILQLCLQQKELEKAITYAEKILKKAPHGSLRVVKKNNSVQYYLREDPKDTCGKYIKKSQQDLIRSLAQKEYASKLLEKAKLNLNNLQKFLVHYEFDALSNVYDLLPDIKRKLITPYWTPDEEYARNWQNIEYNRNNSIPNEENANFTEKGEMVKSKSEKILADKLKLEGIPYHYEKPLYLPGYGNIYPDFTVLNKRTRKEYYWEHLGLMDNIDYCNKTILKIESLEKAGIYPGEKLILTYETQKHPINVKIVDKLIERYLT